ncbi:MAG: ArnT family glycosyltransferase, partial [Hyphomicrobiaceae bacterium]
MSSAPAEDQRFDWRQATLPIFVTVILVCGFWFYHVQWIADGGFNQWDEFFTLDRASSFARMEDWWTVYSQNKPTFVKPPLQYWMSALLMEAGADLELAMRLPSMLFALGCLIATAWLAAVVAPHLPWAMPASVLLLASSTQFWKYSTSAMLDIGAALFGLLAVLFALLAVQRRPVWWYAAAAAVVLGALQKAPIGLALIAIFVGLLAATHRLHGLSAHGLWHTPQFRRSVYIAVGGSIAWPVFQALLH